MTISFHGAARTVTGSKHLLTLNNGTKILFDCGLFQGMGQKTAELNEQFGFDPASVNYVILSHAHIDHSGLIPRLVKNGFKGKIFCTQATYELTEILLYDSAEIQTYDTVLQNKVRSQYNLDPYEPLYTAGDVKECRPLFETVQYDTPVSITAGVEAVFTNAGHLIGSACILLTVTEDNKKTTIAGWAGLAGFSRADSREAGSGQS